MTDLEPNETDDGRRQRQKALARWENEGGFSPPAEPDKIPAMTNAELVQLRIRVIALENLVIALLAEGSERQLEIAGDIARCIAPRAGSTQHPLTIEAATHMIAITERAKHFRASRDS